MSRFRAFRDLSGDYGNCLEVGLGKGELADELVVERSEDVTSLVTYEIDPVAINRYTNKDPARHTIKNEDAEIANVTRTFDSIFSDIITSRSKYIVTQRIHNHLLPNIKRGARVFVEFDADVQEEQDLRAWLTTNIGPFIVKWIPIYRRNGSFDRANSRNIGYFIKR